MPLAAGRSWWFAGLFLLLSLLIAAIGGIAFQRMSNELKSQLNDELGAIAEVKARQAEEWIESRRYFAAEQAQMPLFVDAVRLWRQKPNAELEQRLMQRLEMLRDSHQLKAVGVSLLDQAGAPLLTAGSAGWRGHEMAALTSRAARQQEALFIDVHHEGPEEPVQMDFIVAIREVRSTEPPLGFLFYTLDPAADFYPMAQSWPHRSASAETLIVRREGDEAVFLNTLRYRPNAPLALRLPLGNRQLPAAQALLHGAGLYEGQDYRGVPVLAAARPVAGTSWMLLAKMDQGEVYGNIRRFAAVSIVLAVGAIGAVGLLLSMVWRQQRLRDALAAKQALDSSEERFRQSQRYGGIGYWEANLTTNRQFWSETVTSLLGFPALEKPTWEDFLAVVVSEDRQILVDAFRTHIKGGEEYDVEYRIVTSDGRLRWMRSAGQAERNAEGRPVRMRGIVQDITVRKNAELALQQSLEKFRATLDASPVPYALNDTRQNITYLNPAFVQLFGYTLEDIPTLADWWPKAYPDAGYREKVAAVWAEELARAERENRSFKPLELDIHCKDGSIRTAMVGATPLVGSFDETHLVFLYDITERKQVENALKARERSLASIIETAGDAVVQMDERGKIIAWNNQAENIFGWSREEALGRLLHETIIPLREREAHVRGMARFLASGEGPILNSRIEVSALHRRGHEFLVELAIAVVGDPGTRSFCAFIRDISERKRAEMLLQQSDQRFRALFESSPDPVWIIDGNRFVQCNQAAVAMLGFHGKEEVLGVHPSQLSPAKQPDGEDSYSKAERMMSIAAEKGIHRFEWLHRKADGGVFPAEVTLSAFLLEDRAMLYCTWRDISQRKQAEESMRLASLVYQHSSEAMTVTDADGVILSINPAFTEVTGYSQEEVVGKTPKILSSGMHDRSFYDAMWQAIGSTGRWQGEIWNRRKNGELYPEWLTINTIFGDDGAVHRRVALFTDISEKKASDELIWRQANFDFLTGLPNRRMFQDRLAQEMKKAQRDASLLALIFLDLDHFKELNDAQGHAMGDHLLQEVAQRLVACVRETDTVARLGGDEFTVILSGVDDIAGIDHTAQYILQRLAEPFHLGEDIVYVSTSLGITLYPEDAADTESLLKNADQAMYAAKDQGRNCYRYFTPFMQEAARIRLRLASDLRGALAGDQFQLYYQPIVDLASGHIGKAEALIRWRHPQSGLVSPAAFIPIAEETGMIVEIGDWVFREAARQVAQWRTKFHPAFQISINKSPVQFRRDSHPQWLEYLRELGLPGESVVVEITEGLLMDANTDKLLVMRDAGIQVAIDDFGTGYSSLSYLKKFDIDYLKIDQSFTRNLAPGSEDLVLCEAIIAMAHALGLKVIAEGVETVEQRDLLIAANCDYAQGYWFGKPVPADEFESMLAARLGADQLR